MQYHWKRDELLSPSVGPSGDVARFALEQPSYLVVLGRQIARWIAAARDERASPWYVDPGASRGL